MKSIRLPLLIAAATLAMGACAPGRSATPAPTPQPTPSTAPPSAAPVASPGQPEQRDQPGSEPAAVAGPDAPATAPTRWWLAEADAASPGAGVERAYRELLAGREPERTVVVGVIDSGVDIGHEDLDDNLWVNPDEVPGNGVDDDGNGYIDDIHGWNFIGGPDGSHVERDTYEVVRLYARCKETGEPVPSTVGTVGAAVGSCAKIEAELEESRREAELQLEEIRYMDTAVARFVELLRDAAGTDSLTVEAVESLTPLRMDVRQAQLAYLQLVEAGITPAMISAERQRLEDRLEYGLNPDFEPREIVGDDYDDVGERIYGNPDVTGPRAGHGTGVAGIIAAERGNGIGEDGIAPSARIMVLRAVPDGDERDKDVANAIRYAADNGAHIINMSFGKAHSPRKAAVDSAVRYAEERGVLLVHAAGNAGADLAEEPSYPTREYLDGGAAASWISVGASSWEGRGSLAASFSNYGRGHVDVFAPGVDIRTTGDANEFQTNSGTSFAAPVVSGLAALIMAYYPELDAGQVRRVILESARSYREAVVARPGGDPADSIAFGELSVTGGIVDAYRALLLAEELAGGGDGPSASSRKGQDGAVVFFDDFDGSELDRSRWNVEGPSFWVNNEQQAYVDSPEVIRIVRGEEAEGAENGALMLRAVYRPGFTTPEGREVDFISGRIDSRGRMEFTYGTAAARIRLTAGSGLWPAFWALGTGPWPETGEIDIMEFVGEREWVSVALHGPGYSGDTPLVARHSFPAGTDATGWHVYSVDWTPETLTFRVDGEAAYRVTRSMVEAYGPWSFDNAKFLILNLALGGAYPMGVNGVESPYPGLPESTVRLIREGGAEMLVDWVRVTGAGDDGSDTP